MSAAPLHARSPMRRLDDRDRSVMLELAAGIAPRFAVGDMEFTELLEEWAAPLTARAMGVTMSELNAASAAIGYALCERMLADNALLLETFFNELPTILAKQSKTPTDVKKEH